MGKESLLETIGDFLEFLGFHVEKLDRVEPARAIAQVEKEGKWKTLGISLADYRVKALPGEATPEREVPLMWNEVQSAIRSITKHLPALTYTTGEVSLNWYNVPGIFHTRKLARELVDLALENLSELTQEKVLERFGPEYPLLRTHVERVILRDTKHARRVEWECPNAEEAGMETSRDVILPLILKKLKEEPPCEWDDVHERWLAIVASGTTIFQSAGPLPERVVWPAYGLASHGVSPAFEYIYFWERAYHWYKKIWPPAPPVRKEWREKRSPDHRSSP